MQACQNTVLPVGFAGKAWGLQQPLDLKLDSSVPMVHEHDSLIGGLIRQAGSQADCTAREDGLGVWLLLLMQEGVACHLQHSNEAESWMCIKPPDSSPDRREAWETTAFRGTALSHADLVLLS